MKYRALAVWLTLILCCYLSPATTGIQAPPLETEDRHQHVLLLPSELGRIARTAKIQEVSIDPLSKKEISTINKVNTFEAFIIHHARRMPSERLYIANLRTGKTYEVVNLPEPHRPYSDLIWIDNDHLVFDRWTGPHFGIHYKIDARKMKLIVARPFPDEWYFEQQSPKGNKVKDRHHRRQA